MSRDLAGLWDEYWAECRNGGESDDRRHRVRDAFLAGAAAALGRADRAGRSRAWQELMGQATAELCSDLGPTVGLAKIPPAPAGYAAS